MAAMSDSHPTSPSSEEDPNTISHSVRSEQLDDVSPESAASDDRSQSRRQFMQTSASVIAAGAATNAAAKSDTTDFSDLFQPKEYWQDRMQAPDDGKAYGWFIDTRRCFGCHGCEVSCKAENDVPLGNYIRQTFYKDVGEYPKVARMFLSLIHISEPTRPY